MLCWHMMADAVANSRGKIRGYVNSNLTDFEEAVECFHGEVGPHPGAAPQSGGEGRRLYCMVRRAEDLPSTAKQRPVAEGMLAPAKKVPGCRGTYY
jgi:hypothetical protein